jgi:hypothetical protein
LGFTVIVPVNVLKLVSDPSLNVTTNGAVPVMVRFSVTGLLAQTATVVEERVAVGFGNTVMVAVPPPVNSEVLTQPFASVTLVNV